MTTSPTTIVVCKPCIICGNRAEIEVVTADLERWASGELVQNVFGYLDAAQRELLVSGTHEHCWESLRGGDIE